MLPQGLLVDRVISVNVGVGVDGHGHGGVRNGKGGHFHLFRCLIELVVPVILVGCIGVIACGLDCVLQIEGDIRIGGGAGHAAHGVHAVGGDDPEGILPADESAVFIGTLRLCVLLGFHHPAVHVRHGCDRHADVVLAIESLQHLHHLGADHVVVILLQLQLQLAVISEIGPRRTVVGIALGVQNTDVLRFHTGDAEDDHIPDCIRRLVVQRIAVPQGQCDGGRGIGEVGIIQHIGPVLAQFHIDHGIQHAVKGPNGPLHPLHAGDQHISLPLRVGGQGIDLLLVGLIQASALGIPLHKQSAEDQVRLIRPHQDAVSIHPVVRGSVALHRGKDGGLILIGKAAENCGVGLIGAPDIQGRNNRDHHHQNRAQKNAHLHAHIFEKVLGLAAKLFQFCIHPTSLRPIFSSYAIIQPLTSALDTHARKLAVSIERFIPQLDQHLCRRVGLEHRHLQNAGVVQLAGSQQVFVFRHLVLGFPDVVDSGLEDVRKNRTARSRSFGRLRLAGGERLPQRGDGLEYGIQSKIASQK